MLSLGTRLQRTKKNCTEGGFEQRQWTTMLYTMHGEGGLNGVEEYTFAMDRIDVFGNRKFL